MKKHQDDYNRFCESKDFQLSGLSYPYQQTTVLQYFFSRDYRTTHHMGLYLADKDHTVTLNACSHPAAAQIRSMSCTIEAPHAAPLTLGSPAMEHEDIIDMAVFLESECAIVHRALGIDYTAQDPELMRHMQHNVQQRRLDARKPYIVSGGMVVLDEAVGDMAEYLNEIPKDHNAFQRYILMDDQEDVAKKAHFLAPMSNIPCIKQAFALRRPGHQNNYDISFVSSDGIYRWIEPLPFASAVRLQMGVGGLFTNNAVDIQAQSAMPLHCCNWQHVPADPDYPMMPNQSENRSLN